MKQQTIYIKHMCCQRCIDAVNSELSVIGLKVKEVNLGKATYTNPSEILLPIIAKALAKRGFEIIKSEEERLVESIKIEIINKIHHSKQLDILNVNFTVLLEEKLSKPYRLLNKHFLSATKLTIEKYIILQRIEKVKEMIEEDENNFSEIAYLLGYKTQQHLSGQFKQITGASMLEYRNSKDSRKHLDKI